MIAGHWEVVVVGGRIAGASTAWALAPYAERVLVLDASQPTAFWPQQSTWDRSGNLAWAELDLLETVLACGAPRTYGDTQRVGEDVAERVYPREDAYSFRMSVPREVLDPALLAAARTRGNVTVVRPARVRDLTIDAGRVRAATVRHGGVDIEVTCDLLVLADGRLSRNAERVGAGAYRVVESPWFALLAYYENLPLPTDRSYFSLQDRSVLISTPCGDKQWCVALDLHQSLIDETGRHPAHTFERMVRDDPHLGPAVAAGRRSTTIGGAGRMRMLRRPMSGPGWCLVGDAGYHLDPVTAQGTRAALVTARILRDRVAAAGRVAHADLTGLTDERDAALDADWTYTEQIVRG
ncbi:2-polyprenyl-6-methoxyphenol hydroxylase [Micromonospora nigra]|uniref:2-polyprenyl-6-methoxyphenol hydroxylase n=1 Tax=Micromonospora nigra TaxID=145857 RepID=A0A1C6RBM0_9ACTN|nr:NAD(P)/FAD-dependent oxidoreductase [Micromonospora nigra]SCL14499.1 2-polyprenyl-6-methoxyphenol hydroxylase [Micromonospora nigra]